MISRLVCADRDNELISVMNIGIRMRTLVPTYCVCGGGEIPFSFSFSSTF